MTSAVRFADYTPIARNLSSSEAVSKLGPELDESVFLTAKDAEDFAEERKEKLILCDLCEKLSGLCGLDPDKRLAS